MNISFIGGGNMARAIICGLKNNGFDVTSITVIEPDEQKRASLFKELNVRVSDSYVENSNTGILDDVVVLAVKPQQLRDVCKQLAPTLQSQLVISIAAGIRSADISRWLGNYQAIVRVMPNTPAQIQAGVSALYAVTGVSQQQRDQATTILAAVGTTLWLDNEAKMDAVTAISGSGPAYVFYLIEALQEAAIGLGLNADEAKILTLQTFAGASLLAVQSATDVKTLREQVTSKGGTTEQGLLVLETANIKNTIMLAATAAAAKSRTLGDDLAK
ncbi:pyrroline-5-carboxylate reductase [Methylotenera sp.]|uniref:pyrroline-5-carboxylate reductase n=1 Tax=Methylotenera sp. TaxID=2051956 RepID=UPI0027180DA7|nr:pyrroline-5-carboxylate reductase [Methylotenera sp.]MDO9205183.1 pyrroline-5-carboxylate reductase [Methylotenera sp.]MDO9393323.1 pyrroline-5-carboxylate reductase [Methylotenera sp.]MDP1521737.1 pyrroline-5-carboxylate reductase [Methylotenera sp.]MDP2071818.1 pyrroline-5-carboxylate reductase [Methylotenera sp.]MDP2230172.1 pyrroline-5-carboxylate reductase [Methylotenera sp.]